MNLFPLTLLPENPFTRPAFWDRQNELRTIRKRLLSEPPQCCALVGESYIGKTTLLRYLCDQGNGAIIDAAGREHTFTFVYFDCSHAFDLSTDELASVQFWRNLYNETQAILQTDQQSEINEPVASANQDDLINLAYEFKYALEELVRAQENPVIFALDNFEEVARLPLRNTEWLRSMVRSNCAYIVSSRHSIYLNYQYHPESWARPSPLWNLFSDTIYLGLMAENAVRDYLLQASEQAKEKGSIWEHHDLDFIRKISGRHPELIRIACTHLFERRLQSHQDSGTENDGYEDQFLEFRIYEDAAPICNQLWHGLSDPELNNEPVIPGSSREREIYTLSIYQRGLIDIANGEIPSEKRVLFVLEQRGLIERINGDWHIFAEAMRQYILQRQLITTIEAQNTTTEKEHDAVALTYLEGEVYDYLKAHEGEVCDREDIKLAIWGNKEHSNSALQKIIERIRIKIKDDPDNPRYLIAVRGQGYLLRDDPLEQALKKF